MDYIIIVAAPIFTAICLLCVASAIEWVCSKANACKRRMSIKALRS